jgi:surfactin synthase thioesterase subunit
MSPRSTPPLRLVCFAHAGGSSWVFREMARRLRGRIDVVPIDLPGRGRRRLEHRIDEWPELRAVLASELAPHLRFPYAFLGYSLGALVALSVAHEVVLLDKRAIPGPEAFVACALGGPKTLEHRQLLHRMEDRAMFESLRDLGGIPEELLASSELISLSAPTLRADLRLFETFEHRGRPLRYVPVHAYYGRDDRSVGTDFAAWRDETDVEFRSRAFDGGHMFICDNAGALADALISDLLDTDIRRKSA